MFKKHTIIGIPPEKIFGSKEAAKQFFELLDKNNQIKDRDSNTPGEPILMTIN